MVEAGQRAPEFALSDDRGQRVTLGEFRGRKVVVFFYVRDDTPG